MEILAKGKFFSSEIDGWATNIGKGEYLRFNTNEEKPNWPFPQYSLII
jgi:hypothetical protein